MSNAPLVQAQSPHLARFTPDDCPACNESATRCCADGAVLSFSTGRLSAEKLDRWIARSRAEAEQMDVECWAKATPQERLLSLTQLVYEMYSDGNGPPARLQRAAHGTCKRRGWFRGRGWICGVSASALARFGAPASVVQHALTADLGAFWLHREWILNLSRMTPIHKPILNEK